MIRLIDIRLNAAHPELPLAEAVTYTGAPSTMLIRGVPGNCGKWCITSVYVAATFPDGSTSTRAAVQSANGVWVATLPATATSGRTASGVRIMADGEDENGEIVTGYILGVADFAVASLGVTPAPEPGATSWQMLYFDTVPGVLRKGDVAKVDGVLKLYNGTAWEPFADLSGCVPTSRTINGKALTDNVSLSGADIPVDATQGAQNISAALAGKASTADATLTPRYSDTPTYSEWVFSPEQVTDPGGGVHGLNVSFDSNSSRWLLRFSDGNYNISSVVGTLYDTSLQFPSSDYIPQQKVTATRTRTDILGYRLGPDEQTNPNRDKPLASEAEAEALRQGKQDALTPQQLANIAAVSDALAFDATHSYVAGDPVVYNGTLYTFTAAHTGAWTGSDVSAVDIIARLANKLASTSAAPAWVSGTAYPAYAFCSYNGVVYQNGATAIPSGTTTTPDTSGSGWTAKPVSELFLPLTGGTATGVVTAKRFEVPNGAEGGLRLHYSNYNATIYYHGGVGVYIGVKQGSSGTYYIYFQDNGGTLALTAGTGHTGNLAALDSQGNPTDSGIPKTSVAMKPANPTAGNLVKTTATGELEDAGYHFEVRNGIPCIVQYT